jgi:hypothetical protein
MIHRLRAKMAIDQNGYAGMSSNAAIAASDAAKIANHRPNSLPLNSDSAASSSRIPMISVTYPQLFRLANT